MTGTVLGTEDTPGRFWGLNITLYLKNLAQWLAPFRYLFNTIISYHFSSSRVTHTQKVSALWVHNPLILKDKWEEVK